ncbi:MAG: amidohydrolase family protein [Terriglobia bacterium]
MPFDLLFRKAHIIDPSEGLDLVGDVAISSGKIAAVGPSVDAARCPDVREVSGLFLCPGLIDLHGHWYEAGLYGIDADVGLNHGVTTAVDAGTAGFANFPEFRRTAMEAARVNLLAFVHVSCLGLHAPFAEELLDLRYARPAETAAVIEKHRDRAVGVKVRIGSMTGTHPSAALDKAIEAARLADSPLMVHISASAPEREILRRLRPGDIVTHCLHGNSNGLLAPGGKGMIPEVAAARDRGIIFDVGHGCGSFSWESASRAFEDGFLPDTLSTDLHRYCVTEPLNVTLPGVMSKFLALGMSLPEVIVKTTSAPARILELEPARGTLRIGSAADLFIFDLEEGEFEYLDTNLDRRKGKHRIMPKMTVRAGVPYLSGSVPARLRDLYECDQAVFDSIGARQGHRTPPTGCGKAYSGDLMRPPDY